MRSMAGIQKTPWWKGKGPSVGSKLEAWQKARDAAKDFRKECEKPNYVYKKKEGSKIKEAWNALIKLRDALKEMLETARSALLNDQNNQDLIDFVMEVAGLHQDAVVKLPKWNDAVKKIDALKDGARRDNLDQVFRDNLWS
ncbi:MAG: hypothetical protein L0Y71_02180 [Gemmataceae bacterium]|nr:hypothetical protein [Gemmataceae bacterium]